MCATIALDATYSLGHQPTGVGIYSAELLAELARLHAGTRFRFCYRPHRLRASLSSSLPVNASRALLLESGPVPPGCNLFHGLNQRMPSRGFRQAVCTFHDLFVMTGEYSSRDFRDRFTAQAREAADRAELLIAVSQFTAGQICSLLNVDPSRVRVVHHGIRTLRQTFQTVREPLVLHVGAIQHRKNIVRLVHAFEALPQPWRLLLAGAPNGYGADAALAAVEQSSARERIEVTGYVTPETLGELYGKASICAFASLDEGFGMPVLEAMAHGVPVVASNRSAIPEVCGDAALLVDPLSSDAIAEALKTLALNEELRAEYSVLGRRRATEFSWSKAAARTWSVYRELLPELD